MKRDELRKIGLKIKIERIKHGLSQEKLGEKVGISTRSISLIETGAQHPKFFTVVKIARYLGFNMEDLIDY